ncbi:hypothetical protein SV7mr_31120 [Stieleria bergensis]|uniref:HNH domain-containing protein n=1 Tax=Stieleria bergensis TaxID=2528025 RepID=A0A517SWT8_9BACT|nr:hypothetical protein SV7mr_31120 [Planctomycetes bacterium SV_7m_r]
MISLQFPEFDHTSEQFYDDSVATTTPLDKRGRLQGASATIVRSIAEYRDLASKRRLHDVPVTSDPFGGAKPTDFKSLYGSYMQTKTGAGREFYDALMVANSPPLCAYCGTREAKALDHFLPRKHYPHLSITLENIVACCTDCNTEKLDAVPGGQHETFFHPYYEAFPDQDWLTASVLYDKPVAVVFRVTDGIAEVDRIRHQFHELKLGRIFGLHATTELMSGSRRLIELGRCSESSLREHLWGTADSASEFPWYPWKPTLYRTLAEDDWFCEEGYELLLPIQPSGNRSGTT